MKTTPETDVTVAVPTERMPAELNVIPDGNDTPDELTPNAPPLATVAGKVVAKSNFAPLPAISAGTATDQGVAGGGGDGAGAGGGFEAGGTGFGAGEGAGPAAVGPKSSSEPPQPAANAKTTASPDESALRRLKVAPGDLLLEESVMRSVLACPCDPYR